MKQLITFLITPLMVIILFSCQDLQAQESNPALKFSLGGTIGYTPMLKHGVKTQSGMVYSVFGELEYHKVIGRVQYTYLPLSSGSENRSSGGGAVLGTLGYTFPISERIYLPVMIGGGATYINYTVSIFGSQGDTFTDVAIQAGGILAPYYKVNDHVSVTGGVRFFKSVYEFDRSRAIDLADISVGIRLTL